MIDLIAAKKYCCDKLYLIENYDKAINDESQTWDCHHRLETELNLTTKELKEKDMYFNRHASELIFLTHSEHTKLHNSLRDYSSIERSRKISKGNKGRKDSEETRRKKSEAQRGEKNSIYGTHRSEETKRKMSKSLKGRKVWNKGLKKGVDF